MERMNNAGYNTPAQKMAPDNCDMPMLAMVYSPHQVWRMLYDADVALERGTIFRELDKPLETYRRAGTVGNGEKRR